jgi:tetratricopeptide (TPR) repeat protein
MSNMADDHLSQSLPTASRTQPVHQKPVNTTMLLAAALATLLGLSACSTAPKQPTDTVTRKNEAAEYARIADGYFHAGQYASALQFYAEALETNLLVDHVEGAILARGALGRVYLSIGRLDDAQREFGDALEDARNLNQPTLLALCLSNMGELRHAQARLDEAAQLFSQAKPLAAADPLTSAIIAHNQGILAKQQGDLATAESLILQAAAANETGRKWMELAANRYVLAAIANARGDIPAAIAWAEGALEMDKRAENAPGIAADLTALAALRYRNNQKDLAFNLYRRAYGVWLTLNRLAETERCLVILVDLAAELGRQDYAERYAALLERLRNE